MIERKIELTFNNIFRYIIGFFIIGFGINLMLRSNLGAGAWDATNFNLNAMLASFNVDVTFGTTSLIISMTLFVIVAAYRRKLSSFLMLIPIFAIATFIDFWDLVLLSNFHPEAFGIRFILFISGLLILPFGLVVIISSNFPATVFDEITIMIAELLKVKNFGKVRLGFEILGVVLAAVFSLIGDGTLGAVSIGTAIMAVVFGPIMNIYMKMLKITPKEDPVINDN